MHQPHSSRLITAWCTTPAEVALAQKLRYQVFFEEMGARLQSPSGGLDIDEFDPLCEHLIVRDGHDGPVVGTYRALTPEKSRQHGKLYSDSEFDLSALESIRPSLLEVGRSCVHPDFRSGSSIMALWSGLGAFMQAHGYEYLLGCASVPMQDGGQYAYSLYEQLKAQGALSSEFDALPLNALAFEGKSIQHDVKPPALLKGYLRIGAKICGAPAVDTHFKTADFLTILKLSDVNARYAKHFLTLNHS